MPVVLISIDGFAYHYLEQFKPKNLMSIASSGTQARGMLPVYPSKTFPNHLSIVTGVYPAKHGIIHNKFFHRGLNQNYKLGAGEYNSAWLTAEPIWTKAEKHGLKTAIYFWPESLTTVDKILPSTVYKYKHNTPNEARINKVFEWLNIDKGEQPNFIATYFSIVDETGHTFGTNSAELSVSIKRIDNLIGEFRQKLEKENIQVNLVIVSDHGMTAATKEHSIKWKDIIVPSSTARIINGQTQLYIYEEDPKELTQIKESIVDNSTNSNFTVYSASNYPPHWHFNGNDNVIPDLILDATPPYTFIDEKSRTGKATHGYDPASTDDLLALFIANGPNIKKGHTIETFENIHVYSLIEYLLGLPESTGLDSNKARLMNVIAN